MVRDGRGERHREIGTEIITQIAKDREETKRYS